MKKFILLFTALLVFGVVITNCGDDDGGNTVPPEEDAGPSSDCEDGDNDCEGNMVIVCQNGEFVDDTNCVDQSMICYVYLGEAGCYTSDPYETNDDAGGDADTDTDADTDSDTDVDAGNDAGNDAG